MTQGLTAATTPAGMEWLPRACDGTILPRIEVTFTRDNGTTSRPYSYAWDGPPLLLGDRVRTPRPYRWCGERHDVGTVTSLRSGYEGPVVTLTEKVTSFGDPRRDLGVPPGQLP
jgi:hypothetical protein